MLFDLVEKRFPECLDLVVAWSWLNGHELSLVEPFQSDAIMHVGQEVPTACIQKFGDGGNMDVESATIEDSSLAFVECCLGAYPINQVDISLAFNVDYVRSVECESYVCHSERVLEQGNPSGF